MNYDENKYWVEDSDLLTKTEKIEFARELAELEWEGIIEHRDGAWRLAAGVEIDETPAGPVARVGNKEKGSN